MRQITPPITAHVSQPTPQTQPSPVQTRPYCEQILYQALDHLENQFGLVTRLDRLNTKLFGIPMLRNGLLFDPEIAVPIAKDHMKRLEEEKWSRPAIHLPPQYVYSPSDLIKFFESELVSWIDRSRADERSYGIRDGIPRDESDSAMQLFRDKGDVHEMNFLQGLKDKGLSVYEVKSYMDDRSLTFDDSFNDTIKGMSEGHDVIFQGALRRGRYQGYSDFLIKVQNPPGIKTTINGVQCDFHYEVWDTKLSKKAKPYHILQLCCYAQMLEEIQGFRPENVAVVTGDNKIHYFKTNSYYFYYLEMKNMFETFQREFNTDNRPSLTKGKVMSYGSLIKKWMIETDHLGQIAGISQRQIGILEANDIRTMTELGETELTSIRGIGDSVLEKLKRQAQFQTLSKGKEKPEFAVLNTPHDGRGLKALPPKTKDDIYFDIEGYPLEEGGLEYLLGATVFKKDGGTKFEMWWADNKDEEKKSFEAFIDYVFDRWKKNPDMHVFHYANYEIAAMLRLASQHGTREREVDLLLANNVFVDMYKIVKNSIVVGAPSYSIKYIEHLYRGKRTGGVTNAASSIVIFDDYISVNDSGYWSKLQSLTRRGKFAEYLPVFEADKQKELEDKILSLDFESYQREVAPIIKEALKKMIVDYNIDDCDSTLELYDFLRQIQQDHSIEYEDDRDAFIAEKNNTLGMWDKEYHSKIEGKNTPLLIEALEERFAEDIRKKTERGRIAETFIHLLGYHAREARVRIADMYRKLDMSTDELFQDASSLAEARRVEGEPEPLARSMLFTYRFDKEQETTLNLGDRVVMQHNPKVSAVIHDIDPEEGIVVLKISQRALKTHKNEPAEEINLVKNSNVPPKDIHDTLYYFGEKLNGSQPFITPLVRQILSRTGPKITDPEDPTGYHTGPIIRGNVYDFFQSHEKSEVIERIQNLDKSTLYIQGPPGSGKTTISAEAILDLISQGKRIGISGPSHKAINNLLTRVVDEAEKRGMDITAAKIEGKDSGLEEYEDKITNFKFGTKYYETGGGYDVVAGTPWVFAHRDANNAVDYLFVDEAGQVPLANAVAMSKSTTNMVFVGDPEQLPQPVGANHPGSSGTSIFHYFLDKHPEINTVPEDEGIFLTHSFRMPPPLTQFISEEYYDGRLQAAHNTPNHAIGKDIKLDLDEELDNVVQINDAKLWASGIFYVPVEQSDNTTSSREEIEAIKKFLASAQELYYKDQRRDGEIQVRPITPEDILIVTPYNAQVHMGRKHLKDANIGTVDKFQGQEAPISILSLAASFDRLTARKIEFLVDPHRLNVGMSRAQAITILFADPRLPQFRVRSLKDWRLLNTIARIMQEGQNMSDFLGSDSQDQDEQQEHDT